MITPAATPPQPPEQGGVLPQAWYREAAAGDTRTHADEIMASHQVSPTPAEAVKRGVTPSSGG